ncbi:hypothetical protein TRFO_32436 [Tritrichomonas foetus]|uniref:Uncharacterized protein n=1 Tax=Tritrichomonas foetus TaxID=1144522 RepID=A0A1J4JPS3_9EUKA|nr:hypothetical protein TRFO_32436 [Tritrichomonas foetus]|eukprot:OHT00754.1 hypothetical protein TRFO_32436 [Tritrichomonas foetus]
MRNIRLLFFNLYFTFIVNVYNCMDEESFLGALRKLGGIADRRAARLFANLYESENKVKELEHELNEMNIEALENEINHMKECIRETAKNNEEHKRRIFSCAHLMGTVLVKPEFSDYFRTKQQIEKHKRKFERINRKVEESRKLLKEVPQKPQRITANSSYYQKIVDDYLNAEKELSIASDIFDSYEVDTESLAFSLSDEINEYQNCAKKLNINFQDFDPTEAIGGIYEANDQDDYDSYDET